MHERTIREEARLRVLAASRWAASTALLEAFGLWMLVSIPVLGLMQLFHLGQWMEVAAGMLPPAVFFLTLVALGLRQES